MRGLLASTVVPAAALLAFLLLSVPSVSAHGAPDPRDMELRLLHDHNDDCGGDAGLSAGHTCGDGHDLIALDMREAWDAALGETLVFRLIMAGGAGTMTDTISFSGGGSHELALRTSGSTTTSSDCDRLGSRQTVEASSGRFAVECTVALSTLGLQVGDTLRSFAVQARQGGSDGDEMPGANGGVGYSQGSAPTNYARPRITLKGPVQYADLELETDDVSLRPGQERLLVVNLENALDDQAQRFHFTIEGAEGVRARFHDPSATSGGYSDTYDLDLREGEESFVHMALDQAVADASGTLSLTITSDAGGRITAPIDYSVGSGPAPTTSTDPDPSGEEESPGPAVWMLSGALLAATVLRRRR